MINYENTDFEDNDFIDDENVDKNMNINEEKSNATRFISAYNVIDQTLRSVYNFKRNMTFSDVIRKAVSLNSVIRRYEDKLIDYARLRNAIIHNSSDEVIIAEPHIEVVEEMERIANLVSKPPLVINSIQRKDILTIDSNLPIKKAIELFGVSGFKALPVYENNKIIGNATPARVIGVLGNALHEGNDLEKFVQNTPIKQILEENDAEVYYCVRGENLTVQEALDLFYHNRKLSTILITKSGSVFDRITILLTVSDIMDLSKIVEDYE